MADIFDQIAPSGPVQGLNKTPEKKGDIFDQVAAAPPQPSMLGQLGQAFKLAPANFFNSPTMLANLFRGPTNQYEMPYAPGKSFVPPAAHDVVSEAIQQAFRPKDIYGMPSASPGPIAQGVGQGVANQVQGLGTPENAVLLPATSEALVGKLLAGLLKTYFASTMAEQAIKQVPETVKTFKNPEATTQEKAQAVTENVVPALMAGGVVHEGMKTRPGLSIEDKTGIAKETPGPNLSDREQMAGVIPPERRLPQEASKQYQVTPGGTVQDVSQLSPSEDREFARSARSEADIQAKQNTVAAGLEDKGKTLQPRVAFQGRPWVKDPHGNWVAEKPMETAKGVIRADSQAPEDVEMRGKLEALHRGQGTQETGTSATQQAINDRLRIGEPRTTVEQQGKETVFRETWEKYKQKGLINPWPKEGPNSSTLSPEQSASLTGFKQWVANQPKDEIVRLKQVLDTGKPKNKFERELQKSVNLKAGDQSALQQQDIHATQEVGESGRVHPQREGDGGGGTSKGAGVSGGVPEQEKVRGQGQEVHPERARYDELTRQGNEVIAGARGLQGEELLKHLEKMGPIQKEIEAIKNRNKGMPPGEVMHGPEEELWQGELPEGTHLTKEGVVAPDKINLGSGEHNEQSQGHAGGTLMQFKSDNAQQNELLSKIGLAFDRRSAKEAKERGLKGKDYDEFRKQKNQELNKYIDALGLDKERRFHGPESLDLDRLKLRSSQAKADAIDKLGLKTVKNAHQLMTNIRDNPFHFGDQRAALADFMIRRFGRFLEKSPVDLGGFKPTDKHPSYGHLEHKVFLNVEHVEELADAALHETGHAATVWQYKYPKTDIQLRAVHELDQLRKLAVDALPDSVKDFYYKHFKAYTDVVNSGVSISPEARGEARERLMDAAERDGINLRDWSRTLYGMTEGPEFIAEIFARQQFREFLNTIKAGPTNLFERVMDTVKRILGVKKGTVLERAFDNMIDVANEGEWGNRKRWFAPELEQLKVPGYMNAMDEGLGKEHDKSDVEGYVKMPTASGPNGLKQPVMKIEGDDASPKAELRGKIRSALGKDAQDFIDKLNLHGPDELLQEKWDDLKTEWKGFGNWWRAFDLKHDTLPAMANRVDNKGRVMAQQIRNDVGDRLASALGTKLGSLSDVQKDALSFVVEAQGDKTKLQDMRTKVGGRTEWWAKPASRAIGYAEKYWDKIAPVAAFYEKVNRQLVDMENKAGIPTLYRKGYVSHVQDLSDINATLFERGYAGGASSAPQKIRVHDTFADSIKAGVKPRSLDALDLMENRASAGLRRINREQMVASIRQMKDPSSGKPIVTPLIMMKDAAGEWKSHTPPGYSSGKIGEHAVAIHRGYRSLLQNLTGAGAFEEGESTLWNAAKKVSHTVKHVALMADLYHPVRLFLYSLPLRTTLKSPGEAFSGYGQGLSVLEYNDATIKRMVARGEIDPKEVPELNRKRSVAATAIKTGFNIGRISDNLYKDFTQWLPGVGKYNKWLFEQYQRGIMLETYDMEFARRKKMEPGLSELEVGRKVSHELNIKFGNLGKESWIKSNTVRDLMQFMMLAPQWNEGILRSEIGAYMGVGKTAADAITQKRIITNALTRDAGYLFATMFLGNQLINYYTRGKPTWQNTEDQDNAKISAWIPDTPALGGQGKSDGFFLNPLSISSEIVHQVIQRSEKDKSLIAGLEDVALNKASTGFDALKIVALRRDEKGNPLSDWQAIKQGVEKMGVLPIQAQAARDAIKGEEKYPGAQERALLASVGMKTDPVQLGESERLSKASGKKWEAMSMGERKKAALTQPKSEYGGSKEQAGEKAMRHEYELAQRVRQALPQDVDAWLTKNKLETSGYREFEEKHKTRIPLSEDEKAREQELMVKEFTSRIRILMRQQEQGLSLPKDKLQERLSKALAHARKSAVQELNRTINERASQAFPTGQP